MRWTIRTIKTIITTKPKYIKYYLCILTGNDGPAYDEVLELEWWEEEFLPLVASAFSCGYTSADDDNINPRFLPGDIRDASPNSITIRQVWRFVKGYIRPPQKQREGANSQQDFDVFLYVPFLPLCLYRGKDRSDGTSDSNLDVQPTKVQPFGICSILLPPDFLD